MSLDDDPQRDALINCVRQLCNDLNQAHDEICKLTGVGPKTTDWPEWTPQANSIRWAEDLLGEKLAKTNIWTLHPSRIERWEQNQ